MFKQLLLNALNGNLFSMDSNPVSDYSRRLEIVKKLSCIETMISTGHI